MRILVTGASGLIGQTLCQALVTAGDEVRGLVRSRTCSVAGVTLVEGDLRDEAGLKDLLTAALQGIECVVYLAARMHVLADTAVDPLAGFRADDRDATLRLAALAQNAGVKRFVFMSSIGVNGLHTVGRAFSEFSAVAPQSPYAQSKLEAEEGLRELLAGGPTELVIIRPELVYAGHAPGDFHRLLKLVSSATLLPFPLVSIQRPLAALENLVDFIVLSTRRPKAMDQIYLVGDEEAVSIREIIEYLALGMFRRCLHLPIPPFLLQGARRALGKLRLYTPLCGSLVVDSSKALTLGWVPRLSAKDALVAAEHAYRSTQ
ncbi:NAD-dependent epimerase/dehydratase family protein [Comamonas terrigena]|uniref:NAD-dependent epimerase/dehydratase family protein n=1 Tax=Comamonas terrigena TaxID=32013 RepID=UPI002447DA8D|nr:NAD-dependent epimerase/dehydratase family protein [Comamonas terrigena]MDH1700768.1 NAD-dependent epimerase/dehydratase family protein [Comamonas terrigena]